MTFCLRNVKTLSFGSRRSLIFIAKRKSNYFGFPSASSYFMNEDDDYLDDSQLDSYQGDYPAYKQSYRPQGQAGPQGPPGPPGPSGPPGRPGRDGK